MESNYQILKRKIKEKLFLSGVFACALLAILPLVLILSYVFVRGFSALDINFFTQLPRPVGEPGGGMGNALVGSFILVGLACLIGLPIGILGGIYLAHFGKGKRGFFIRYAADVLSSIPSIVIGIFVYTLIVLPFRHFSAIAGGMALAIIMIPTITRTTEEMIKMVPRYLYEAGLALGLPEWKVLFHIVFRSAWTGIFTGIILSVSRVLGETAPLLFTAFSSMYWNVDITQPTASMTVYIYNYAISPFNEWHQKAWAASLTLLFMVLSTTLIVRKFSKKVQYG